MYYTTFYMFYHITMKCFKCFATNLLPEYIVFCFVFLA